MGSKSKHNWEAEEYHNNSSAQEIAATQLLHDLHLTGREQVLDVGCGDGKITAKIANLVPSGSVLGIDASPTMIEFARGKFSKAAHPNLTFLHQDGQQIDYPAKFDLIFSSFAIQWMPEKNSFFKGAFKSLKPLGRLAITMPVELSPALWQSIQSITSSPEWAPYFQSFSSGWHFIDETEFVDLLEKNHFRPERFDIIPQTSPFHSRELFERDVASWFSYLNPLPEHLKQVFLKQVVDGYLKIEPPLKNGEVHFKFLRYDVIVSKPPHLK